MFNAILFEDQQHDPFLENIVILFYIFGHKTLERFYELKTLLAINFNHNYL